MLRFYIPNMTCGGCAKSVTQALLSVDPQARIESTSNENAFHAVLSEAGYPIELQPSL